MQLKTFNLIILLLLSGCAGSFKSTNKAKTYANNCQNPREIFVLYKNGTGKVTLRGITSSLTWKKKGGYIQIKQKGSQNIITAHYDREGNIILQSFSHRNEQYFSRKNRIRYLCN